MNDTKRHTIPGETLLTIVIIQATNAILDPGASNQSIAYHRISPFACLYDTIERLVDITLFLLYSRHNPNTGLIFFLPHNHFVLRCILNATAVSLAAILVFTFRNAYGTKLFTVFYLACWLVSKIKPVRGIQDIRVDREVIRRRVTNPAFFVTTHISICFALFKDMTEAALWSWFGMSLVTAVAFFWPHRRPAVQQNNIQNPPPVYLEILHLGLLATVWLFCFSPLGVKMQEEGEVWYDVWDVQIFGMVFFQAAMVFFVQSRRQVWTTGRFAVVGGVTFTMVLSFYWRLYDWYGFMGLEMTEGPEWAVWF